MKRTASIVALIALPSLLIAWGGIHLGSRELASVCAAVEGHKSCSCGCQKLRSHANRMATEAGVAMLLLLILALCGAAAAFAFDARRTRRQSAAHKAFVADISHRLRTPLTGICLNADLLKEKRLETEAELDDAIADIADNSARLTGLVEQLLDHVAKS